MKQLVIIGAGGFGREVLGWARESTGYRKEWEIAGFLDDRPDALDIFPDIDLPILGNTSDYMPRKEDIFICAVGNPGQRAMLYERFSERESRFTRIIHQSCIIGRNVELGPGVILCPRVVLTCDLAVGTNTALNVATAAGHDAAIGEHCQDGQQIQRLARTIGWEQGGGWGWIRCCLRCTGIRDRFRKSRQGAYA